MLSNARRFNTCSESYAILACKVTPTRTIDNGLCGTVR